MYKEVKYAGFWIRMLATILDALWILGVVYGTLWYLIGLDIFKPHSETTIIRIFLEWVFPSFVVIIFWIISSATPGKMVLKLKIVSAETFGPVKKHNLLLRYMAYLISAAPLCLGYLWIAFDKKKQGWHDKIANTVVIYTGNIY